MDPESGHLGLTGNTPLVLRGNVVISQLVVEVADGSVSPQRVAQLAVEVLYELSTTQQYGQVVVECLCETRTVIEPAFDTSVFGLITWIELYHVDANNNPTTLVYSKIPLADPGAV